MNSQFYTRKIASNHVVIGKSAHQRLRPFNPRYSRIIKRKQVPAISFEKVRIIGGDHDDPSAKEAPAIVIEQENGQIARIIVTCPCGRHAELVCDHEDN